ncbi:MAG TPA: hypothetical protein VGS17_06030, partial [Candidatus Limnocylindria bacterium]|nr:hypothetical protein [Candidatus Limnocylindria bacterium]
MAYAPAEMAIRATEDLPYGQGAADLAATRERRQAAQSTGKPPDAGPAPAGPAAVTPGQMQSPDAQARNAEYAQQARPHGGTMQMPADPPDWPADVALRQQDTPPSGAELGVTASRAHQYLMSRPTTRYGGQMGMSAADRGTQETDAFGRPIDPTADARGRAGAAKFWSDVGNAPIIKQTAQVLKASHEITQAGLGFLDSLDPQHRDRYYANVAAKAKELNLPPDNPQVMWEAAQEQWLQEPGPFPVVKGLLEMMADPSNVFFVGAGEAVGAVRAAGGVREVAGAAGRAAVEAGPKAAGGFADAMGVRAPQRVAAQSLADSPEVLRLQGIADRLRTIPGAEKDIAEIEAQLAEVRGQGARAGNINAGLVASMKPTYRESEITWASPNDKAIYTVTDNAATKNKMHGPTADALRAAGFDDAQIVARGKEIRADLKTQYQATPGESLHVEAPAFAKSQDQISAEARIGAERTARGVDPKYGGATGIPLTPKQIAADAAFKKKQAADMAAVPPGGIPQEQLDREAAIRRGEAQSSDVVPGERPQAPAGQVRQTQEAPKGRTALRMPGGEGKTPFESPTVETAGVTRAEAATPPIVYPTEENLGIPKGLMDSLPDNLRSLVVDEARKNYGDIQQARGGVVPRSQVDAESEKILIDAGVLAQAAPRTPVTAPGMIALQRAIMRVAEERTVIEAEAMALGPAGISDQLRARFAVKIFEQNSLQRVVAGARAEWGRVGQAMQTAIRSGDEVKLRNTYNDIIRAVGKNNIDKVMERLQAIRSDPNLIGNPYRRQVAEFKLVHNLNNATGWQKLDEVFFNAVLSIPHTHMGIIVGQFVLAEAEALAAVGGAAVNALAHAATLGRIPYEQTFTKAIAEAVGTHVGIATGLQAAKVFLRTGIKRDELAQFVESGRVGRSHALEDIKIRGRTVVPVAGVGNLPTTLIDAYTVAFHEMGRQQSLWGQAFAKAQSEKLGSVFSKQFRARVSELMGDPAAELDVSAARDQGRRVSLRGAPKNALSDKLREIRDLEIPSSAPLVGKVLGGMAPGRRVVPFINIAFNLAAIGAEYSPLGFIRVLNPANQLGAGARSVAAARAGMGSLLFKHLWDKADQGELTGPMPTDPNERAQWNRDGKQAYSYKVGNEWIPFDRVLGPMATPARWVTGVQAAAKEAEGKPLDAALAATTGAKMLWAMGEAFGDTTFMLGPDQIIQAGKTLAKGDMSGATNYLGQQAVAQMPFSGFLRSWAQSADPLVRHVQGFVAQLDAAIPGLSQNLPPVMDAYGKPVARQSGQQGVSGVVNPIRATTETRDPVDTELAKHSLPALSGPDGQPLPQKQLFASMATKEVASFKLTTEEGAMVQTLAGRATHQGLIALFATAEYNKMDPAAQTKAITKAITDARAAARRATADAIMQKATTPIEVIRAADMHISLVGARYARSQYLEGLSKQGKLTDAVKKGIDAFLAAKYKGQPTVAEYLKAAPLVRQYLAAAPFDRGTPAEWALLAAAKTQHAAIAARDKLDGTKKADAFVASAAGRV